MNPFECIKPNPYPMKNRNGYIGYGCLTNKRTKANIVSKRKCGRYIRKYGFDITETWSLDYTIASWLSDNVGGFFRKCGNFDDWSDYDLNGVPYKKTTTERLIEAEQIRQDYFLDELETFLEDYTGPLKDKFCEFVVPRIHFLADHTHGYPAGVKSFESWQKQLHSIANKLETEHYSIGFLNHFFSLWD
jgi:hypothetical protein